MFIIYMYTYYLLFNVHYVKYPKREYLLNTHINYVAVQGGVDLQLLKIDFSVFSGFVF